MMVLSRFDGGGDRRVQSLAHATDRLMNAFSNAHLQRRDRRRVAGTRSTPNDLSTAP